MVTTSKSKSTIDLHYMTDIQERFDLKNIKIETTVEIDTYILDALEVS